MLPIRIASGCNIEMRTRILLTYVTVASQKHSATLKSDGRKDCASDCDK
jgi:hypothetical protein